MIELRQTQRIDKWLWHARFAKTRTAAQKLVSSGAVRVDRLKITSPSRGVAPGNTLTITTPRGVKVIEILTIADRRGPYSEACKIYLDHTPQPKPDTTNHTGSKATITREGRPDKQKRRAAIRLKQNFSD